jgi:glycosyltransferase involved in cell wall biosynthesis
MAEQAITVVIPVFNEAKGLDALVARLVPALDAIDGLAWQVLFVDDGSRDETLRRVADAHARDARFTGISFSRNFGKETAIAAGLHYARGDAAIVMDADLQHPPEVIAEFIARWRAGSDIVFGQRRSRDADAALRRLYSQAFHAIFRRIAQTRLPSGIVDFLLLDRKAVDSFNRLGERTRFSKGLYAWIGYRTTVVPFDSPDRFIGESSWSFITLAQFALDGFVSFSTLPLKIWSYVGAVVSLFALIYGAYVLLTTLLFRTDVPGFPTLVTSIMFFSGIQLVSLGIIGEYLARIYDEVKARPLFIVAEEIGISAPTPPGPKS